MKHSRRNFLALAGASSLLAIAAPKLWAQGIPQEILNKILPLPGQYGEYYGQAKIRAFHLHNQPDTSPLHKALEELWLDVFKQTEGELFVTPIPQDASIPAGDPQAVQFITGGRFEIVSVAGPIIDKVAPDIIGVQNFPLIYQSSQDAFEIINQPLFAETLNGSVAQYNLTYLPNGTFDNGMRVVTSIAKHPINKLEDFQNLKIRIPPSNDMEMTMKALGAIPEKITMNQVFRSLENGTVEAQENPLSVALGFELYKVTKYLNMTNHAWSGYNTFFNTSFWNSLSPEVQNVIRELLPIYQAKQIKAQEEYNQQAYQKLTSNLAMVVTEPNLSQAHSQLIKVYQSMYGKLNPQAQSLIRNKLEEKTGIKFT
ncbi:MULTISPECIES: TRAP transporter substrate-binding protein [unclassified Synechocystis]|uniref:TRAP transporter substrate-binding protein n=1 Tax=unclassified Synechocystis TaxID=2640012 RepID=UPI0004097662|nr:MULTISPECIES: TRAP transporter substrate-binding protein [unclassified Synechocystis]AIE73663.1 putative C4-dicarboxylase binding protein, periplasmic protein [Synechocystis sp. PCC 6714]MCT0255020.1 TRAP transporter substrate-binding protein [Synechocystis sp. CS-94]